MIITDRICSKFLGYVKFNRIPIEVNPAIPIKSYKDQCREHIIGNGMWYVFSFLYPCKQDTTWEIFLNQYIFHLDYTKLYIKDLNRDSKREIHGSEPDMVRSVPEEHFVIFDSLENNGISATDSNWN